MVQFLNAREPQAFLAGLGMLLILSIVAVAVLDGIVVAGMEVLGYFSAVCRGIWVGCSGLRSYSWLYGPSALSIHAGSPLLSVRVCTLRANQLVSEYQG